MFKRFAALAVMFTLPTLFATEGQPETQPIDVGIVCGPGSFYAHNFSGATQVLVFHQGSFVTWRVLRAGETFSSDYTRQQLDGVFLEVANYDVGVWRTSRSFDLANLCDAGVDALWIRNQSAIDSWLEVSNVLTRITPGPSMLPINLPSTAAQAAVEHAPEFAPTHTPVITPVDHPQGDVPPVLGDRPLPPF